MASWAVMLSWESWPELFESTVIADYLLCWSMNFPLMAESDGAAPFAPVAAATAVTRLVLRPPRVKLPPPPRGFLDLDPLISGGRCVTTDSLRFDLNRFAICS